jgi:NADPH:quinone reductase-like Zn-dependent oxidoreductase
LYEFFRNRTDEYKAELIKEFSNEILPKFSTNQFVPVIDKIYSVDQIKEAHERMEKNENIGKIIIKWEDSKI